MAPSQAFRRPDFQGTLAFVPQANVCPVSGNLFPICPAYSAPGSQQLTIPSVSFNSVCGTWITVYLFAYSLPLPTKHLLPGGKPWSVLLAAESAEPGTVPGIKG